MIEQDVIETLDRAIRDLMPELDEPITPDSEFARLGLDSLGVVDVIQEIEERFGITVPDDQVTALLSVGDVIEFVRENSPVTAG